MNTRSHRLAAFIVILVILAFSTVILFQAGPLFSVKAQTIDCAVAPCTPTPTSGPTCGLPGLPPCNTPVPNSTATNPLPQPTRKPIATHTSTPTSTATPTGTPTSTATMTPQPTITTNPTATLVPTSPFQPTPEKITIPPVFKTIPDLISFIHPPQSMVSILPPWMQPDNLKVTDIEITQAVQCLHNPDCPDNSVPLYSGKVILVRAYVRLTTGPDSFVYPIGGALCYGNTGAGGCSNPIRPVQKTSIGNEADPVSYGRGVITDTLDFILPMSYATGFSTQTLTVYANYNFEDLPSEIYYKDNYKSVSYQLTASQPIYVRFYPVQDNGFFTPAMEWAKITDYLSRTYPTGEVYPSLGFPLYGKNYAWTTPDSWGCPKGWHDLINDLWYMRSGSGPVAYGEVSNLSLAGGVIGCGVLGGPEAAGIAGDSKDGRVAAQEIGHTMNLPHVPGCGAGGADMSYPKPNGLLDEFGTDVNNLLVYWPSSSYDFMGYCGGGTNTWTSIYTYNEIAGLLPEGAYLPGNNTASSLSLVALDNPQFLVGSGDLSPTEAKLTQGFYLLGKGSTNAPTPDKGPYTLELLDGAGKVLYTQHFDLAQMSNDSPQTAGGFQLVIPWAQGTNSVVFKYQGQVIGQVTASAHTPTITLTAPVEGVHWGVSGNQTVSWNASDADGNALSYLVQFSPDGGKTWSMLAANLQTNSFTFDASYLPGGANSLIRVEATDGFNTTQTTSQAISVDPKAPLLYIASPQEGQSFDFGTPVVMHGVGTDLIDGPITGDQYKWTDNVDGNLGTGGSLVNQALTVGDHTITLSVTNSSGLTSTISVHIKINPPVAAATPGTSAGSSSIILLGLILVILVGLIVLLVVIILRGRRHKKIE